LIARQRIDGQSVGGQRSDFLRAVLVLKIAEDAHILRGMMALRDQLKGAAIPMQSYSSPGAYRQGEKRIPAIVVKGGAEFVGGAEQSFPNAEQLEDRSDSTVAEQTPVIQNNGAYPAIAREQGKNLPAAQPIDL
jgi:hypothetical protein